MAGSDALGSLIVILRAVESLGLLVLTGVFLAAGTCMNSTIPGKGKRPARASRIHRRIA